MLSLKYRTTFLKWEVQLISLLDYILHNMHRERCVMAKTKTQNHKQIGNRRIASRNKLILTVGPIPAFHNHAYYIIIIKNR